MSVCKTGKVCCFYPNQFYGIDIVLQLDKNANFGGKWMEGTGGFLYIFSQFPINL